MRIYLIGYMGSGKTSVAQLLAERLNIKYIDTDEMIEAYLDKDISTYFEQMGEDAFRILEAKVLDALIQVDDCVIATGGGMPCNFKGINKMNQSGISIYLNSSVSTLAKRLLPEKAKRPAIKNTTHINDLEASIILGLANRRNCYQKAQIEVSGDQEIVQVVNSILTELEKHDLIKQED
jgi:shikimate kinase